MELNHRFPGCGPGVFAARPRDHIRCSFKWSHRESHPDFQRAMLASSCWTMTPICSQRKPRDSNPQTAKPSPVFKTGSSTIRMASVKFRGLESNQRTPGSGPGVTTNSNCPGSFFSRHGSYRTSSGRRGRTSVFWFKARKPTASRSPITFQSALRELNPPRQLGRLAPLPLGQGHARRKERESNPQGSSLGRFRGGCHRQLACASVLRLRQEGSNLHPLLNRQVDYRYRIPDQCSRDGGS